MKTRTQIVFTVDASVIIFHLFLKPGCRVVESGSTLRCVICVGTGSGALSTHFAKVIAPLGHLFTFEYNEMRASEARREFAEHGLQKVISSFHRDAYKDGFVVKDESNPDLCVDKDHPVDAVFLDLPKPYCGMLCFVLSLLSD